MTLGAALLLVAVVGLVGLVWVMFALVALALVAGGEPPVACVRSGMPVIRAETLRRRLHLLHPVAAPPNLRWPA